MNLNSEYADSRPGAGKEADPSSTSRIASSSNIQRIELTISDPSSPVLNEPRSPSVESISKEDTQDRKVKKQISEDYRMDHMGFQKLDEPGIENSSATFQKNHEDSH